MSVHITELFLQPFLPVFSLGPPKPHFVPTLRSDRNQIWGMESGGDGAESLQARSCAPALAILVIAI